MARFLTLTALLAAMFVIAACGGGSPQGSERDAPAEPQQTQAAPATERVPAEDEDAESTKEDTRQSEESSGLSVTTIEGEEVKLGAQGDVTALFFMAGW
jgi:ABC-type glycerol-3-phosphate transport system substrate-binding protein